MFPIKQIELKQGSSPGEQLTLQNPSVTVFVGPNNSGKSMLLRELAAAVRQGRTGGGQILGAIAFHDLSKEYANGVIERLCRVAKVTREDAERQFLDIHHGPGVTRLTTHGIRRVLQDVSSHMTSELPVLLPCVELTGTARLQLVQQQPLGNLGTPTASFARMVVNDSARARLKAVVYEAFKKHLVFDGATQPGICSLRLSAADATPALERSFTDEALAFFRNATPIDLMSDGVRAFTGMLIELFAGEPAVLLIDEPEAFLHPALAFLLGREVARPEPADCQKNVFVATHSPSFLMGCVQSGAAVNVVRLAHAGDRYTARLLDSNRLREIMRNPLLRSVGAIEALFYEYVVVTEADADRAFYDEVNHRLVMAGDPRGVSNCLFLRAQCKQTICDIVRPLRALGIPTAGIVDVDVYEEGGANWSALVSAAGFDHITAQSSAVTRNLVKKAFAETGDQKPKTRGGVNVLTGESRRAADEMFDRLDEYGMFAVRHGEMENWLPETAPQGLHGPKWLVETFKAMGDDASDPGYCQPAPGDVWDFIGKIGSWLRNPVRKGI